MFKNLFRSYTLKLQFMFSDFAHTSITGASRAASLKGVKLVQTKKHCSNLWGLPVCKRNTLKFEIFWIVVWTVKAHFKVGLDFWAFTYDAAAVFVHQWSYKCVYHTCFQDGSLLHYFGMTSTWICLLFKTTRFRQLQWCLD